MGCAICLDDFDQADGDSRRATALTCGHIFHYDCLQTWFYGETAAATNRHIRQRRCPLCSVETQPGAMVRLYPSDGNDLDTYLAGQQLWEWIAPPEGEGAEDHRNLKQLLNDLMDFNTAVQNYVMATHSIRYDKMVKCGAQVRKLFIDLAKDMRPELKDALMKSMDALEDAASSFSTMFNDLGRRCRKNRTLQNKLLQDEEILKKKLADAQQTSNAAQVKMREAEDKAKEVDARIQLAQDTERLAASRMVEIARRQDELDKRERELRAEKRTHDVQTNLKIANIRAATDAQLQEMRNEMDKAVKKSEQAEKERQVAHNKSCQLAEQMQQMQQRLKGKKKGPASGPLNGLGDESDATNRRIKALEARNKAMEEQLKNLGMVLPEHRLARNVVRNGTGTSIDLTRSSSPLGSDVNTSPATPLDGFELISQASTKAATASDVSPTVQRMGKKRAPSSLSVEPEQLDDEMDEAHFPVPGFGGLQMPGQASKQLGAGRQTTAAASSTSASKISASKRPSVSSPASKAQGKKLIIPGASTSNDAATAPSTSSDPVTPSRKKSKTGVSAQASTPNNKRKRVPTPSTKNAGTGTSTSTSAGTTSSAAASSSKPNKPNQHDWLNKTNGLVLGPKRRSKAQ